MRHAAPFAVLTGVLALAGLAAAQAPLPSPEDLVALPPAEVATLCQAHAGAPEAVEACAAAGHAPLPPPAPPTPWPPDAPALMDAPAPVGPADARWRMRGTVDATLVDLALLRLDGNVSIERVVVHGAPLDAKALRAAHRLGAATGAPDPLEAAESSGAASLRAALGASGARTDGLDLRMDRAGLADDAPADAPLHARIEGDVLPPAPPDPASARRATAALRAGATLALDLALHAPAGADLTYRLHAPDGLAFASASAGDLAEDGRVVTLRLDNAEGADDLSRPLGVALRDPAAAPPAREDARARLDVTLGAPEARGVPIAVDVALELRALDLAARFPGALPPEVSLPFVGADGLRALHAEGALSERHLLDAEAALLDALRAGLAARLPGAEVSGNLTRADLAEDLPPGAPLRFHAQARAWLPVDAGESRRADLALALGATLAVDAPLPAAPVPGATYALHLPPGLVLVEGALAGGLPPEGGHARLLVRRADAPQADATDAHVSVQVDLRGVEIDSGQLFSGGDPRMVMDVTATTVLRAVELPADARAGLDPRVHLTHVTSDGIRLLRAEGMLDDATLAAMERALLANATRAMRDALGGDADPSGGFVRPTLAPEARGPILFVVHAALRAPVGPGQPQAGAAIALHSVDRTLTLPRLEGLDTEYALLLPHGIEARVLRVDGGEATVERVGGRDRILLRPEAGTMTATAALDITPTYLLASHGTAVFALLLALVLVVEAPVAFLMLRKGKRPRRARA